MMTSDDTKTTAGETFSIRAKAALTHCSALPEAFLARAHANKRRS